MTIQTHMASFTASCLLITALSSFAIDIGDPVYKQDMPGRFRVEALFEKYDRDIELKFGQEWFNLSDGAFAVMDSALDSFESDNFMLRLGLNLGDKSYLYFDAGLADADIADSSPNFYGVGTRFIAYENRFTGLRVTLLASGHYFPSFDVNVSGVNESFDRYENIGEVDFYELNGGIILSGIQELDGDTRLVPYGGILLSMLRGSFDVDYRAIDSGIFLNLDGDIEEKQMFTAVAGLSLLLNKNLSARIEGRFVSQTSVSIALGAAF